MGLVRAVVNDTSAPVSVTASQPGPVEEEAAEVLVEEEVREEEENA